MLQIIIQYHCHFEIKCKLWDTFRQFCGSNIHSLHQESGLGSAFVTQSWKSSLQVTQGGWSSGQGEARPRQTLIMPIIWTKYQDIISTTLQHYITTGITAGQTRLEGLTAHIYRNEILKLCWKRIEIIGAMATEDERCSVVGCCVMSANTTHKVWIVTRN